MDWWSRWRSDLRRPEVRVSEGERWFLIVSTTVIAVVAQVSDPAPAIDLLLLVPAVLAFVAWTSIRAIPAEAFAATVIASVALAIGVSGALEGALFLVVMMMLYTSWHLGSLTRAALILAVSATVPWVVARKLAPEAEIGWTPWTLALVFTFASGRLLYRQQLLITQLDNAREALAAQAVAEERRRIARELHDLAGHTLAAMLLHVTGARHVLRRDVDEAERALVDAETIGRSSLDQIRATVSALRTYERGTDPALPASADINDLVAEYRRAGLMIECKVDGAGAPLDGPLGTALHRIAREALANVARHAPQNSVELTLDIDEHDAHLVVIDRGRRGAPPAADTEHFGLVGMGERARALGGHLEAGPTSDGWMVDARLPLTTVPVDSGGHDTFVPS